MSSDALQTIGWWRPSEAPAAFTAAELLAASCATVRRPVHIVHDPSQNTLGLGYAGEVLLQPPTVGTPALALLATLPALYPEWLGERSFQQTHGCRFPYIVGEMARGIASPAMVIAAGRAGLLGFFGSAGLSLKQIEHGIAQIKTELDGAGIAWGANLIHSPNEPELEGAVTDLLLKHCVRRVSASAFMALTPNLVRYACTGLSRRPDGTVQRQNYLFAKVSRSEVARHFMAPASVELLQTLVASGELAPSEAELARQIPLAEDITVEADSGGHTDNRPLGALFPTLQQLRDSLARKHRYTRQIQIRLGAAGGLGCPNAVAAAFALGAAYVLTGSINQAAVESGLSVNGRVLLLDADISDVAMAPAADMFELGVKVQVLKRGTMFAARATQLYQLYQRYDSIEAIPIGEQVRLEKDLFRAPLEDIWAATRAYFEQQRPQEIERAERDSKHRLALVCRWYLGNSSRWAITGEQDRRLDYQAWCGPAMGAFNNWVAGSFLEPAENRSVAQIGRNLLEGAAVITRVHQLRCYGVPLPSAAFYFKPRPLH